MAAVIIVEDGTEVSGANSYITTTELATYADERGVTISASTQEDLLIEAMDYIESLSFLGIKKTRDQSLVWPRYNVVVDEYLLLSTTIPQLLQDAQAETALAIDRSESPLADIERKTKKEGLQPGMFIEYADNSSSASIVRKLNAKLHKLLASGIGGVQFKVDKA